MTLMLSSFWLLLLEPGFCARCGKALWRSPTSDPANTPLFLVYKTGF